LEACATAHYWARELGALGHEVRLMPAQYLKAYIEEASHTRVIRIETALVVRQCPLSAWKAKANR
jgi:transposase